MRRSIGYLRENMEYGELRSTNNLIAAATVRSQPSQIVIFMSTILANE